MFFFVPLHVHKKFQQSIWISLTGCIFLNECKVRSRKLVEKYFLRLFFHISLKRCRNCLLHVKKFFTTPCSLIDISDHLYIPLDLATRNKNSFSKTNIPKFPVAQND